MCMVGIDQCPYCEAEYATKAREGTTIALRCPDGHEWTVTSAHNIGEFYPKLAY